MNVASAVSSPRSRSSSTTSANSLPNTIVVAPASAMMNASSSGTRRQFSGTAVAPSLAMAKYDSSNSTEFIISRATRSPRPTPSSSSTWAVRLTRSLSSANVKRRPVATSTIASRSGFSSARFVTKCPMFVDVFVICR